MTGLSEEVRQQAFEIESRIADLQDAAQEALQQMRGHWVERARLMAPYRCPSLYLVTGQYDDGVLKQCQRDLEHEEGHGHGPHIWNDHDEHGKITVTQHG